MLSVRMCVFSTTCIYEKHFILVAVGRDANLPCVVEHLGSYKVIGFTVKLLDSMFLLRAYNKL